MGIKNIKTIQPGSVGVVPNIIKIDTDDSTATILTSTYLNKAKAMGYSFSAKDMALVNGTDGVFWAEVVISGANTGLQAAINPGNVTLPVVDNDFAQFDGTTGKIKDGGKSASDNAKTKVVMADAATTIGQLGMFTDVAGTIGNSTVVANRVLQGSFNNPSTNINMVSFDVSVGQAALASAGQVILQASGAGEIYKIRGLWLNAAGTNFSGGGGDRNAQITDGTTVYSVIPAATLQSLANTAWGATGLPFPAAASIFTDTVAAADIYIEYQGGTTDYTAGSLFISALLERRA